MKPHVKLYLDSFRLDETDWIGCECCNNKAVDIHHIEARGMGGTKKPDVIENLMALCRTCHERFGDKKQYKKSLKIQHETIMYLFSVNPTVKK